MKAKLELLDKLSRLYVLEKEREAKGLQAITDFFRQITKESESDCD
jgi:Asp-tRNA(Asn)/Glu-tRNA(Gln) amidotransferase C subunit